MILKRSHFTTFHDCLDYFNNIYFINFYYYYDIIIIIEKEDEVKKGVGGVGLPLKFL